jgi:hypothetical protein
LNNTFLDKTGLNGFSIELNESRLSFFRLIFYETIVKTSCVAYKNKMRDFMEVDKSNAP